MSKTVMREPSICGPRPSSTILDSIMISAP
jgi:hypothetical protein